MVSRGQGEEGGTMRPLVGTEPQIHWAAEIRACSAALGGEEALPDMPSASWWISMRAAHTLEYQLDAAAEAGLAYSPFVSTYPRYGRDAAIATLRSLSHMPYTIVDTETTGIGKSADIVDIAMVDGAGPPRLAGLGVSSNRSR